MLRQFVQAIYLSLALMSCDRSPEIRVVSNDEYAIDKSCWGGEDGRYKGVGVFSEHSRRFFLLSDNCSTKESSYKFSAFTNMGLVRISDKDRLIAKELGGIFRSSNNFATPVAGPGENERLYLSDIVLSKKVSDGFVYFEIVHVERLEATNMSMEDLLRDFKGTMRKLRELQESR